MNLGRTSKSGMPEGSVALLYWSFLEPFEASGLKLRNWLLFLFVVLLWGSNWSIMKISLGFVAPITLVLHQFIISTIVLSPVIFVSWRKIPRDRNTLGKLLFYSLIVAFQIIAQRVGLSSESSGIGAVFTYTFPLFVCCFATLLLGEKVTATKFFGIMMGFMGVFVLLVAKTSSFMSSSSLILIFGAFLWALTVLYYKKFLTHVDPIITVLFQLPTGILPAAILSLFTNSFVLETRTTYVLTTLYSSIGALVIGGVTWLFLLKEEEANVLSGSSFIVPVVALLFGWGLLGEPIYIESALGSALVLAGLYLVNLKHVK